MAFPHVKRYTVLVSSQRAGRPMNGFENDMPRFACVCWVIGHVGCAGMETAVRDSS